MLFQTKLVVLGKAVYQSAFLAFENRLNVDLLLSCLGLLTLKNRQIF